MTYIQVENRVIRDDGFIAVQHRTSNGTNHKIGDVIYTFSPQHNVCLGWVAPEHVQAVLSEMARICCGKTSKKFFLAGIVNVNIFYTGTRDGENK